MRHPVAILLAAILLAAGCQRAVERPSVAETTGGPSVSEELDVQAYTEGIATWQKTRSERLQTDDSWLTLVGLHWLREGENGVGSDPGRNNVILPEKAPASAGTLVMRNDSVMLQPTVPMTIDGSAVSAPVAMRDDTHDDGPTIVQMGPIRFNVIKRGERYAVRVKDAEAETRVNFAGLEYYPIDPAWRIEARLDPYDPPKKVPITDVTGMTAENIAPGALVFSVAGEEYRLDPILEGDRLFIIFRDETSRDTTYPAGRYLYSDLPGPDGRVIVDFNRAYNPPCAFTDFATCPLPPPQNRLSLRVEAGEKKYALAH
jgi:uncharacterized protein